MFLVEEMPGPRRRSHGTKQKQAGLIDRTLECHPVAQYADTLKTLLVQNWIRRPHQLRHVALSLPKPLYYHFTATTRQNAHTRDRPPLCPTGA
jgi:hypothetical protein